MKQENNIFQNAAQILYGKNKQKEDEEKNLRNSLLNQLGDKIETKHILYSSTEDLKKMKEEEDLKNSNNPLNKLGIQITGGAASTKDSENISKILEESPQPKAKLLGKIPTKKNEEENYIQQNPQTGAFRLYTETIEDLAKRNDNENNIKNSAAEDEQFNELMKHIYKTEGGFIDNPKDKGGRTNKGITQATYNAYNKKHGLPLKDVKDITNEEADAIYYTEYYKASGADKIEDKNMSYIHFDSAINHGVGNARRFLKESEGDFDKYYQTRKNKYDDIVKRDPSQKDFYEGWINRINRIKKIKDENLL